MTGLPADDDELIRHLRGLAGQADPPPPIVLTAARAALTTRRLDEELAELMLDSHTDPVGVRSGADDVRVLSFESTTVTVELQVRRTPDGASLRGLVGGAQGRVTLEMRSAHRPVDLDEDGWFTADGVPAGLLRLRLTAEGGAPVVSSWVGL